MHTDIITGPVGGGKTKAAIDEILFTRQMSAFSTVWVLLATGQQIRAFQNRLLAHSQDQVQFGVEFFNFEGLYTRLLDLAGDPQRLVSDTARYRILRHVIAGVQDQLELFGPIAELPGFIGLVAGLIHELKQGLVKPEKFTEVAQQRGPKDRDLARIYTAYQEFLQAQRLVDRHGAGWLAIEHLQGNADLACRVDLLVVDGFDQFNRVNATLLTALAQQVNHAILTLTTAPDEQGRRFRRFEQTRKRLLEAENSPWQVRALDSAPAQRPAALDHLVCQIFRSQSTRAANDGSLHLIEAPDTGREVETVLRRVKRLLLDGTPPESVVIIARRMLGYSDTLRETARAYELPLVVREGIALRENPAVAALLALIDLPAQDFRRRDLLDTLHSPYLSGLEAGHIALLERISMEQKIVRGRDLWLDEIARAAVPRQDEDGEPVDPLLDANTAHALRDALHAYMTRITPPAEATMADYVGWIETLIGPDPAEQEENAVDEVDGDPETPGHLDVIKRIRSAQDTASITRDILALNELKHVLTGLRTAHDLVDENGLLPWDAFRTEFELALDRATVMPPGGLSRLGRVLATDVLEARGLPHDHVFILGLAEGIFPAPVSDEALYQESERLSLEADRIDMQTVLERADDMSLFYQAIGLARQTLTLSRFYVDAKGTTCPPSAYWSAVRAAVDIPDTAIQRVPVGAAPGLDEAATLSEAAVAVAAIFSGEHDGLADPIHRALLNHPLWGARWANVLRGRALEARREDSASPFDRHTGILTQPDLIAEAARQCGPNRVWSASQLTEYGICPFRFFARRLLRLEELTEPEEGMDVRQIGSINHAILEGTYRQIEREGLAIQPENQERAEAILNQVAAEVFATAPERYQFRASTVWEHEQADLLRRLVWLVRQDFSAASPLNPPTGRQKRLIGTQLGDTPRTPYHQEASFGFGDLPPVEIDGPAGPVQARGKIDRMDRAGDQIVVIDYKTGSRPHPVDDMAAGRDFQMMLYLLAAHDLLGEIDPDLRMAGGLFWHIGNRKVSGEVLAGDPAVEQAREQMHAQILDARAGRFAVQPRKLEGSRCISYCEFGALCRMSRGYLRKQAMS